MSAGEQVPDSGGRAELPTDPLQAFIDYADQFPLLSAGEEVQLAKRIEQGDLEAKEQLINSNLRLVISIAGRYRSADSRMPMIDRIHEGVTGLTRAAEVFDHRRGNKFSTPAGTWIMQAITRALANKSRIIRIPVAAEGDYAAINRTIEQLSEEFRGHEPSDEEIAETAGIELKDVQDIRRATAPIDSLDKPVGIDGDYTVGDFVPARSDTAEEATSNVLASEVRYLVRMTVDPREREIIMRRFGIGREGEGESRSAIAKSLGTTEGIIRHCEQTALSKLREAAAGAFEEVLA